MQQSDTPKSTRRIVWLLVILPLWLVSSTLVGLWMWTKREDEVHEPAKFAMAIDQESVRQELVKVVELIGSRHTTSEGARTGLRRMAAYIEGTLGPDNAGYRIERVVGPAVGEDAWPILLATLPGKEGSPLWVVTAYDQSSAGGGVEANATGVVSVLAVAQEVAGDRPDRPIVFAFLPHGYDLDAPVLQTLESLNRKRGEIDRMLVIEAMGHGRSGLMASSRSVEALGHPAIDSQTKVVGAEAICLEDDQDLSAALFETGSPAIRIATRSVVRADEPDADLPDPAAHARATAVLAALVRSLAGVDP